MSADDYAKAEAAGISDAVVPEAVVEVAPEVAPEA